MAKLSQEEREKIQASAYCALQSLGNLLKSRDIDEDKEKNQPAMKCLSGQLSIILDSDTFEVNIIRKPHQ